jgi:hypothetical protein
MRNYKCSECGKIAVVMSHEPVINIKCCKGDEPVAHKYASNMAQNAPPKIGETEKPAKVLVTVPPPQVTKELKVQTQNTAKTFSLAPAQTAAKPQEGAK